MSKRRRDILKTCLAVCSVGALAGCGGFGVMGGSGQYPANLHNVTQKDQEVSITVTNNDNDSVVVEETYELAPGKSVEVGDSFKETNSYAVEVVVIGGNLDGEQSTYEWNASDTLQIMILDDRIYFALPAS